MVDFKLTADGKIDVNSVNIELAAKDDPETCKKVEDFCAYLDAYQSSLSIPATVVDDLNTLAAEIGKAAMGYGYIEGTKDAGKAFVSMMQARTQMDKIDQPAPSVAPCSVDMRGIRFAACCFLRLLIRKMRCYQWRIPTLPPAPPSSPKITALSGCFHNPK